ncbi:hypothetical protein BOTCAL_0164g00130 [Botryotinia calthae]|uniref:Uncharacterized protein n=1 Tax=Botryotinia calthae TaxID=38488 RepID=A0A4Y8D235_9HELO|nr:hypothetical protein BOTCAL_0164g00130 [Botryotinia calthae]
MQDEIDTKRYIIGSKNYFVIFLDMSTDILLFLMFERFIPLYSSGSRPSPKLEVSLQYSDYNSPTLLQSPVRRIPKKNPIAIRRVD